MSSELGGWLALGAFIAFAGSFLRERAGRTFIGYHAKRRVRRFGGVLIGAGVLTVLFGIAHVTLPGISVSVPTVRMPSVAVPGSFAALSFWGKGLVGSIAALVIGFCVGFICDASDGILAMIIKIFVAGILFFGGVIGIIVSLVALIFF